MHFQDFLHGMFSSSQQFLIIVFTGDIMGCGILFPRDYNCDADSDGMHDLSPDNVSDDGVDYLELEELGSSDSEDEEWWEKPNAENGTRVQVCREIFFFK